MTYQALIAFLQSRQPMPRDEDWTQEEADTYDQCCQHFAAHPDIAAVPLLLNSFGEGDGLGMYVMVEATVLAHPAPEVIAALRSSLRSQHRSVRYWSTQIAVSYPDPSLLDALLERLHETDSDMQIQAAIAISAHDTPQAKAALRDLRTSATDAELIDILDNLSS